MEAAFLGLLIFFCGVKLTNEHILTVLACSRGELRRSDWWPWTYVVDPKEKKNKSEKSETIGWREIISVILVTPDISGLFLMVFYKADYFGGFGHLRMDFGSLAQRKGKDPVS